MDRKGLWLAAAALWAGLSATAQGVQHLATTQPGGMPGLPVMGGIESLTNGVRINWDGPSGYYQIYEKSNSLSAPWTALGQPTNLLRYAVITRLCSNAFFRVSGPAPKYAGAKVCLTCHANICSYETNTPHAGAFSSPQFAAQGGQTNNLCLPCHTVGYGLPTGFNFTNAAGVLSYSANLAGVQCENCHGPAANHAAAPDDPTVVPRVEIAATVCGGCHSASPVAHTNNAPTFEEWSASGHAAVVPAVVSEMGRNTNDISTCGRCHSGSARLALLAGQDPSVTVRNDYDMPITCAVCHAPHAQHVWTNGLSGVIAFTNSLTGHGIFITNTELGLVYTNQLLYALSSTNDFVLTTSDVFTNAYNPNINVCAQCHNDRGAAWMTITTNNNVTTTNYLTPHHSPQYNMLLGTVGELLTGPTPGLPSTHSRLEMQCAACHMQTNNGVAGHTFEVTGYQLCLRCHGQPAALVQFITNDIAEQIQLTKVLLDLWATDVVPQTPALNGLQKYGTLAWEYTTPGDLSPVPPNVSGPSAADQALIPDDIKKARFDLYLVLYDGSYGVHNAPYDIQLLEAAQYWVVGQLYQ
jgi:hypothetical protein